VSSKQRLLHRVNEIRRSATPRNEGIASSQGSTPISPAANLAVSKNLQADPIHNALDGWAPRLKDFTFQAPSILPERQANPPLQSDYLFRTINSPSLSTEVDLQGEGSNTISPYAHGEVLDKVH